MRKISLRPQAYASMIRYYWLRLRIKLGIVKTFPVWECKHKLCKPNIGNPAGFCHYDETYIKDGKPTTLRQQGIVLEYAE